MKEVKGRFSEQQLTDTFSNTTTMASCISNLEIAVGNILSKAPA